MVAAVGNGACGVAVDNDGDGDGSYGGDTGR